MTMKVGQRVLASFDGGKSHLGVVSGEVGCGGAYPVQFQPHGSHYYCYRVSAYGDAKGWTDQEYRVEREKSYCQTRAQDVERERRERFPAAPFSMCREAVA